MLTFLTVLLLVVLSRVFNQEGKRFLDWLSVFPLLFSNDNYYTLESGIPARPHIGRCSGNFDQEPGARPECSNVFFLAPDHAIYLSQVKQCAQVARCKGKIIYILFSATDKLNVIYPISVGKV